jgi:hypothetical protein
VQVALEQQLAEGASATATRAEHAERGERMQVAQHRVAGDACGVAALVLVRPDVVLRDVYVVPVTTAESG